VGGWCVNLVGEKLLPLFFVFVLYVGTVPNANADAGPNPNPDLRSRRKKRWRARKRERGKEGDWENWEYLELRTEGRQPARSTVSECSAEKDLENC